MNGFQVLAIIIPATLAISWLVKRYLDAEERKEWR